MKNKKGFIALISVIAVCVIGAVLYLTVGWPVDNAGTSGNIGKSSRFSRKTADQDLSNMEELVLTDTTYKNGIVAAYMVMSTRAQQFATLVDMSNEVAGEIPEYADVLEDMNKVRETVNNVCNSLGKAGEDLNSTLLGESTPELAQNTMNASLAYSTLQKQNKLATRFIEVTDKYIKKADAPANLKYVCDQWVDYQLMTASLEGDEKAAKKLADRGSYLTTQESLAAFGSMSLGQQIIVLQSANLSNAMEVANSTVNAFPTDVIRNVFYAIGNSSSLVIRSTQASTLQDLQTVDALAMFEGDVVSQLGNATSDKEFVNAVGWSNLNMAAQSGALNAQTAETIGAQASNSLGAFVDRPTKFNNTASDALNAQTVETIGAQASNAIGLVDRPFKFNNTESSALNAQSAETIGAQASNTLGAFVDRPIKFNSTASDALNATAANNLNAQAANNLNAQAAATLNAQAANNLNNTTGPILVRASASTLNFLYSQAIVMGNMTSVIQSFGDVSNVIGSTATSQLGITSQIGEVISNAAIGNVATLNL